MSLFLLKSKKTTEIELIVLEIYISHILYAILIRIYFSFL